MVCRIMSLRDAHVLSPGTYDYVMVHGEEELSSQMELSVLIS